MRTAALFWMILRFVTGMDKKEFQDLTTPLKSIGEGCGYERCPPIRPDALNVHVVPHSHGELGYDKVFEDHFTGDNEFKFRTSPVNMKRILDAVITELWEHEHRTFTFTDLPYFFHWWSKRDATVRRMVYTLVRQGRFNFAGGGWSMSDEATTNYQMLIDSHTYGLRKLNATFMKCGRPLVAWQAHAYGHSKEFASIIALMGYDALFVSPISFDDELNRMGNASLEFIWRGNDDLGIETDIFTHSLFDGFDSPPGFCFSSLCTDALVIVSDKTFTNVAERVSSFLTATVHRQSPYYRTQHIMVMMGGSRAYHDAQMWYRNIERLIEYTNTQAAEKNLAVRTFFSSPACYLKSVHASNPILPIKQDDFLPLRADNASFATGMYTSRPTIKYMIAEANRYMQIAKQLQVLGRLGNNDKAFEEINWILGVMQDHNIITGASSQPVTDRYNHKLYLAVQRTTLVLKEAINSIRGSSNSIIYYRCDFNISSCHNAYIQSFYIIVYNPLAWPVTMPIRLPVRAGQKLTISDPKGNMIPSYLMKIPDPVQNIPGRYRAATEEVVFLAEKLPPLGFRSYYFDNERLKVKNKRSVVDYPEDEDEDEDGNFDLETRHRNRREEVGNNNENIDSVIKTQDSIRTTETIRAKEHEKEVVNNYIGEDDTEEEFLIYIPDNIESTTTKMDRNNKFFDQYQERKIFYLNETNLDLISVNENNPKNDNFVKKIESKDDNPYIITNFENQTKNKNAKEKNKVNKDKNKYHSKFKEMSAQEKAGIIHIQNKSNNQQGKNPREYNENEKNIFRHEFKEKKFTNNDFEPTIRKYKNKHGDTEIHKNNNLFQTNAVQNYNYGKNKTDLNNKTNEDSKDGIRDDNEIENCKTTTLLLNQSETIVQNNCIEKPQTDLNNNKINKPIGLQHDYHTVSTNKTKHKYTKNLFNENISKIKASESLNNQSLLYETSLINYSSKNEITSKQVTNAFNLLKINHQNNFTLHNKPVNQTDKIINNTHHTDMTLQESTTIQNHNHAFSGVNSKIMTNIDFVSLSEEKITNNGQSDTKNVKSEYDNKLLDEPKIQKKYQVKIEKTYNKNLYYQTSKPLYKSHLNTQNQDEKSYKTINHRKRPTEEGNDYGINVTLNDHIYSVEQSQSDENKRIESSYEVTDRNTMRHTDTDTEEIAFSIESTKQESFSKNYLIDTTKHLMSNREDTVSKSNIDQNILNKYTNQHIENKHFLNKNKQNDDLNKSEHIDYILKINKEHIVQANNAKGDKEKYKNSQKQVNANSTIHGHSDTTQNKPTHKLAKKQGKSKKSKKYTKKQQKLKNKKDKEGVFCNVLKKQAKFSGSQKDTFEYNYIYDILCSESAENQDEFISTNDNPNQQIKDLPIKNNKNNNQNKSKQMENFVIIKRELIPQINNTSEIEHKKFKQTELYENLDENLTTEITDVNNNSEEEFCNVLRNQNNGMEPEKVNSRYANIYDSLCQKNTDNREKSMEENSMLKPDETNDRVLQSKVSFNRDKSMAQNSTLNLDETNSSVLQSKISFSTSNINSNNKNLEEYQDEDLENVLNEYLKKLRSPTIDKDKAQKDEYKNKKIVKLANVTFKQSNKTKEINNIHKLKSPVGGKDKAHKGEDKNKNNGKLAKVTFKQTNKFNEINEIQMNKTDYSKINKTNNGKSNETDNSKSNETNIIINSIEPKNIKNNETITVKSIEPKNITINETNLIQSIDTKNMKINKTKNINLNENYISKVNKTDKVKTEKSSTSEKTNVTDIITTDKPDFEGDQSIENINYKFKSVEEEIQWYKNLLQDPDLKYDAHEYERRIFNQKQRLKDYKKPAAKISQDKIPDHSMFETTNIIDDIDLPYSDTRLSRNKKYKITTSVHNTIGKKQIGDDSDTLEFYRNKDIDQSNLDNCSKSQSNLSQCHTVFKRGDTWLDDPYLRKLSKFPSRNPNADNLEITDDDEESDTEKPKWDPKLIPGYYLREEKKRKGVPLRTTTTEKPKLPPLPTPTTKKPIQPTTTGRKIKYSHRKAQLKPLRTTESPAGVKAPKRLPPVIMHRPKPPRIPNNDFGKTITKPTRTRQKEFSTESDEETPSENDFYINRDNFVEATTEKKVNIKKRKPTTQKETPTGRRKMVTTEFKQSQQTFIENQYLRVSIDPRSREVVRLNLSNGLQISLNVQFYYYEADDPVNTGRDGIRPPGAHIFRTLLNEPKPIKDKFSSRVYTNPLVQELHITFSDWASVALRVYNSSPVVEVDWVVGPVPLTEDIGREIFIRYKTSLVNNGVFYTDANGRQMMKRIRNKRPTFEPDNVDTLAGNIYPVTSKITIRDTHKNMRFAVFNDRSQGGTSLNDGEIDLFLHRRILTVDDDVSNAILNETHDDVPIRVRGTHYLYLTKANYKPNKLFEKKFAKEIALQPQVLVSGRVPGNKNMWRSFNNEYKGIRNKIPFGIHILTLERLSPGKLLIRLENYLQKSEMISAKPKRVYLKKLLTNIAITSIRETTLAANQFLSEAWTPLQWKRETQFLANFNSFYGTGEAEYNDEEELRPLEDDIEMLKEGIWLEPQQIRSFIAQYEYDNSM